MVELFTIHSLCCIFLCFFSVCPWSVSEAGGCSDPGRILGWDFWAGSVGAPWFGHRESLQALWPPCQDVALREGRSSYCPSEPRLVPPTLQEPPLIPRSLTAQVPP